LVFISCCNVGSNLVYEETPPTHTHTHTHTKKREREREEEEEEKAYANLLN